MSMINLTCPQGHNYSYHPSFVASRCPYCRSFYQMSDIFTTPKTQKAKGLYALQYMDRSVGSVLPVSKLITNLSKPFEEPLYDYFCKGEYFARPCPPNPEHGFVESRVLKCFEDLEKLREETFAENPASEIMITPLIKAEWNAIWTPALLAIGAGHDGATAGKNVLNVPLSGINPLPDDLVYTKAGIKSEHGPYIEAVGDKLHSYLTQLRGGPVLESGVGLDYIPTDMVVSEVIKTNGEDLIEWAKVIRALKGKAGVIIWHPGGGLTDHYSVHCRENNVPIAISFEPVPGLVLEKAAFTQVLPLDPQAMIHGLATADRISMGEENRASPYTALSLFALHHSGVLRGPHSFWIGAGIAALLKLGSSALRGEARHAHALPKGMKMKPECYQYYGKKTLSFHRASLSRVSQILHYGFGDPNTSHSFGGRKWALCGAAMGPLFDGIRRLVIEPTHENASKLVLDLNVAINQAHNGGWWLNKFIIATAYDKIQQGWPDWAVHVVPALRELDSSRVSSAEVEKFKAAVQKWPETTTVEPLKWRRATLDVGPGSFILNLKAATVPTPRQITIPTTQGLLKSLVEHLGEIKITPGEIRLQTKNGESIPLWHEEPLRARLRDPNDRSTW
jgi:hypothetical protein